MAYCVTCKDSNNMCPDYDDAGKICHHGCCWETYDADSHCCTWAESVGDVVLALIGLASGSVVLTFVFCVVCRCCCRAKPSPGQIISLPEHRQSTDNDLMSLNVESRQTASDLAQRRREILINIANETNATNVNSIQHHRRRNETNGQTANIQRPSQTSRNSHGGNNTARHDPRRNRHVVTLVPRQRAQPTNHRTSQSSNNRNVLTPTEREHVGTLPTIRENVRLMPTISENVRPTPTVSDSTRHLPAVTGNSRTLPTVSENVRPVPTVSELVPQADLPPSYSSAMLSGAELTEPPPPAYESLFDTQF